jgi:hypothetical protein
LTDSVPKTPAEWRNFQTRYPITACRLKRDGLKVLYRLLDERQSEYRGKVMSGLSQMTNETADAFRERRTKVFNAFVVSVTITAENGQVLTGNNERVLDETNLPSQIKSVFYSTHTVPHAVLSHLSQDRLTLFLDFSQPPMWDFNRLPTLSTPNESNFEVTASNESWFVTTRTKLVDFFEERRSGYEWLHRGGIYDILLAIFGLPLAIWACVRLEALVPSIDTLWILPRALIYIYTLYMTLALFRVIFSYSRWVFPKIEMENVVRRSPLRHRAAWAVVLVAIFAPAIYDTLKAIVGYGGR